MSTRSQRPADPSRLTAAVFERAQVGMAILCLEERSNPGSLRVVAVNPAASRISELARLALGKRVDHDFPEIASTPLPGRIAEVILTEMPQDLGDIRGVYDTSRSYSAQAFPIPPDCCGILFDDVTEQLQSQRALRESEQRFRKIFEASPAGICVFEPHDGVLIDVNPRFVELLGYGSSAALVGKRLDTFGIWAGEDEYRRLLGDLKEARSLRETYVTYRTFGGQVRRALVALELIEIEGKESVLGLFWRV